MSEELSRREGVCRGKQQAETSWFNVRPQVSLDLIAAIVDVGAGDKRLVDCLLEQGFHQITVLDSSHTAPAKALALLPEDHPSNGLQGMC